ncbi:MAG: transposase [Bacteroidota bacterium]
MTRTRYEPDFKLRVVREALETRNAFLVARRHNLAPKLVARWVRQYGADGEAAFFAKRRRSQLETPELGTSSVKTSSSRSYWARKTLRSPFSVTF